MNALRVPMSAECAGTERTVFASWSFSNTSDVEVDGTRLQLFLPDTSVGLPFVCATAPHRYTFIATGPGGSLTRTITVQKA